MQPAFTKHSEHYTDFPVSPKKYIRHLVTKGYDFIYCNNFTVHCQRVYTEEEVNGELYTRCEYRAHFDLHKPVMIIGSIITNEGFSKAKRAHDNL